MNNYYGTMNGINNGMGTSYQQPARKNPELNQLLTDEQLNKLRKRKTGTTIPPITERDMLSALCTHKADGNYQVQPTPDGSGWVCKICGEYIPNLEGVDVEEIEKVCQQMVDIIQYIKLSYINVPTKLGETYFKALNVIERIPEMYKVAKEDFKKFSSSQLGVQQNAMSPYGGNLYNNIVGGGYGINNYNMQAMQQPGFNGNINPMGGQLMGMPQAPMGYNPLAAQGFNPQMGGYPMGAQGYNPQVNQGYARENKFVDYGNQTQGQQQAYGTGAEKGADRVHKRDKMEV